MDRIYKGARKVIIWLGEEDIYTEGALKTLNKLAEVNFDLLYRVSVDDFDAFTAYNNLRDTSRRLKIQYLDPDDQYMFRTLAL